MFLPTVVAEFEFHDLPRTLATRVRTLSMDQVHRTWWTELSSRAARERLRRLAAQGLLVEQLHLARAEVQLDSPIVVYRPGHSIPDLAAVARHAQRRWNTPPRLTLCAVASRSSGARFGGRGGRSPRDPEWTHDLHLAQVYLSFRAKDLRRAASWIPEDLVHRPGEPRPKPGEKQPDALVRDGNGLVAIELVGSSYDAAKLEAFHTYCAMRRLAYELW